MAWDWDTADIDLDKDDGQIWVPITLKTLEELTKELQGMPKTPEVKQPVISQEDCQLRDMAVYVVLNGPEGAAQANALLRWDVLSPQIPGPVVSLNTGKLSDLMELSEAEASEESSEGQVAGPKAVTVVRAAGVGWKGVVPKCVPVTMPTTPRGTSCDRCHRMGRYDHKADEGA